MKKLIFGFCFTLTCASFAAEQYLGVATEKLDPALGSHMGIPKGFGLIVRAVDKQSQAHEKLEVHDVLLKLDDQHLLSPEQLTTLIGRYDTEETVELEMIRKGKKSTIEIPLSVRPASSPLVAKTKPGTVNSGHPSPSDIEKDMLRIFKNPFGNDPFFKENGHSIFGPASEGGSHATSSSSYTFISNGSHISLMTVNGKSNLLVKDAEGKTVFDGPVNTEDELEKVPPDIRKKLESLNKIKTK